MRLAIIVCVSNSCSNFQVIFNVDDTSLDHIIFKSVHFASIYVCIYGAEPVILSCSHLFSFFSQKQCLVYIESHLMWILILMFCLFCLCFWLLYVFNLIHCDFEFLKFCFYVLWYIWYILPFPLSIEIYSFLYVLFRLVDLQ